MVSVAKVRAWPEPIVRACWRTACAVYEHLPTDHRRWIDEEFRSMRDEIRVEAERAKARVEAVLETAEHEREAEVCRKNLFRRGALRKSSRSRTAS